MNKVAIYLNQQISGNVFDNDEILERYSSAKSILKIKPKFIAFPENTTDIENLLNFINQLAIRNYKIPIGIWGSGQDTTGADLTSGLLISTERLNKVKEIDVHDRLIHIQSGVTLEQLNTALQTHGLFLPIKADPKATIGSLIANCPTDPYAAHFGGIMNYVERIEVVLSDGTRIQTSPLKKHRLLKTQSLDNLEGKLYRRLPTIIAKNEKLINHLSASQNLSGYRQVSQCYSPSKSSFDLLPIFYASQGTLGVITEAILRADVIPPKENYIISIASSFEEAYEILSMAKPLNPTELSFYDLSIINTATKFGKIPPFLAKKLPENGYLVYLSYSKTRQNSIKWNTFFDTLPKNHRFFLSEEDKAPDKILQNILASYLDSPPKSEHPPLIQDIYIPNPELKNLVHNLKFLEKKYKTPLPLYGSFATNIYSICPKINLKTEETESKIPSLLQDFSAFLDLHHGNLAGGTPEGRLKAPFISYPDEEKGLIKEIKSLFDPQNILSPEVKKPTTSKTIFKHTNLPS